MVHNRQPVPANQFAVPWRVDELCDFMLHMICETSNITIYKSNSSEAFAEKLSGRCETVNECGLTLAGFQSFFVGLLKIEDREIPWTMQRKFGYDDDVKLANHFIPALEVAPNQFFFFNTNRDLMYCVLYL